MTETASPVKSRVFSIDNLLDFCKYELGLQAGCVQWWQ